jgi:hypothetical protein
LESKDMALEAFRGKTVFSRGSGVALEFLEWLEGLWHKDSALAKFGDLLGILVDFWRV